MSGPAGGPGDFTLSSITNGNARGNNRAVTEKDTGGFLQLDFNTRLFDMPFVGNLGLRYVKTEQEATGYQATSGGTAVTVAQEYSDTLPSMNLALNITRDVVWRLAAAKVMARPQLGNLSPGGTITTTGNLSITVGNPLLKPFRAATYDTSFEWYIGRSSFLGVGFFYKDIDTYIQTLRTNVPYNETGLPLSLLPANFTGTEVFQVTTPVNTKGGPLKGYEINYQQAFTIPARGHLAQLRHAAQLHVREVAHRVPHLAHVGGDHHRRPAEPLAEIVERDALLRRRALHRARLGRAPHHVPHARPGAEQQRRGGQERHVERRCVDLLPDQQERADRAGGREPHQRGERPVHLAGAQQRRGVQRHRARVPVRRARELLRAWVFVVAAGALAAAPAAFSARSFRASCWWATPPWPRAPATATRSAALFKWQVECLNLARGGRSTKSFRADGSWERVKSALADRSRPTFVLIQFGHNDQPGKPERSTGLEREFPANLERYVDEVRAAGAKPVLVTPLTRRSFRADGTLDDGLAPWAEAVKRVAAERNLPLLDLHADSAAAVSRMGPAAADALAQAPAPAKEFDHTHVGPRGAALFARMVAREIDRALPSLAEAFAVGAVEPAGIVARPPAHGGRGARLFVRGGARRLGSGKRAARWRARPHRGAGHSHPGCGRQGRGHGRRAPSRDPREAGHLRGDRHHPACGDADLALRRRTRRPRGRHPSFTRSASATRWCAWATRASAPATSPSRTRTTRIAVIAWTRRRPSR
jgi:lysophospholipase L1-like esterase